MNMKVINENQTHCWYVIRSWAKHRQALSAISFFSICAHFSSSVMWLTDREKRESNKQTCSNSTFWHAFRFSMTIDTAACYWALCKLPDSVWTTVGKVSICHIYFFSVSHFSVQPYLCEPAADSQPSQHREQRNNNSYNKKTTLWLSSFLCFCIFFPSFSFHLSGQGVFFILFFLFANAWRLLHSVCLRS